ncbi:MAG: MBL fold metallo-hydrolase [Candidatus Limnocylindrales bacterium]
MTTRPSIDLFVAGAGPAYTDRPGATGAAYLLRAGGSALLLDFGQGSFPRLAAAVEPSSLGAVVISHLHPDHFVDLVPLRHYLRYQLVPARRVRVIGPPDLGERLDALHGEPGFAAAALDIEALEEGIRTVDGFTVEARRVTHTDASYAFRVSVGAASRTGLVYSGDCGRADDLVPLIRPGDTLLAEVSFGPGPVPTGAQHLDGPQVGRLAAATGAGRVLLTHVLMGFDPEETVRTVRDAFGGEVRFVWPGDRLTI